MAETLGRNNKDEDISSNVNKNSGIYDTVNRRRFMWTEWYKVKDRNRGNSIKNK